jgi:hypothetical protein
MYSSVFTFGVLVFFRSLDIYMLASNNSHNWSIFYSVFGVLYAIIIGFLMLEALSKYNKLSELIAEEINNLQDIRDFTLFLNCDTKVIDKISVELSEYAKSVIDKEWQKMESGSKTEDCDTTKELYEVLHAINNVDVSSKTDELALKIIMSKMAEVTTMRTKRLSVAQQKLPIQLKGLLYLMSTISVTGLIFLHVDSLFIHMFMVMSLLISVHLLHMIISDLDNPFKGSWSLTPELFIDFYEKIKS